MGEYDVTSGSIVVLVIALSGLLTTPAITALLFSLVHNISAGHETATLFAHRASKLLYVPVLILFYILWFYLIIMFPTMQFLFQDIFVGIWAFFSYILFVFCFYRTLTFLSFVILVSSRRFMNDELLTEYVKDILPLIVSLLTITLTFVLLFSFFEDYVKITGIAKIFVSSLIGYTVIIAFSWSLRDGVSSVCLLADRPFVIGDMIEICGVAGVVQRVGALNVVLRKEGVDIMSIPSRRFSQFPCSIYTRAPTRRCTVYVRLKCPKNCGATFFRAIITSVSSFLLDHCGVGDAQVSLLAGESSCSVKTGFYRFSSEPINPTLVISWETAHISHVQLQRSKSDILLAITDFFADYTSVKLI